MPEQSHDRCATCGVAPRPFDSVHYGGEGVPSRLLCGRCFNLELAESGGLDDFEHIDFEPVTMSDAYGLEHVFEFRTHLFGDGVAIDAIEFKDDQTEGYRFKVIGPEDGDLLELLARLITKMRRGLAHAHLEDSPLGLQISNPGIVRARVECDLEGTTGIPLVVIDGRSITWDEVGRMVSAYEGFQFKLEMLDLSDEI